MPKIIGNDDLDSIAVIGISGRFPDAKSIKEFWENIKNGVESVTNFSEEELIESGISKSELSNPNYVKSRAVLEDADMFDAEFFGYSPREAKLMDPQHRLLLESSYEALENAGLNPETYEGDVGVFMSASFNTYLLHYLSNNPDFLDEVNTYQLAIANGNDFLATKIAYKLNLKGPAETIQTACSSSLVAIHHARQSILNYECDSAIVGGVSITTPLKSGYLYKKDGIGSPDGHCRPFDSEAAGTISGNGVGVVVLKRYADAIENNDHIYAVIKGSAINNDGNGKIGYTAPSAVGQARAISMTHAVADIDPSTIEFIEAHGTGTKLGDPIEIEGLTQAFNENGKVDKEYCAISSVKANIGHLDAAAGITGFIKAALSLYNAKIPPAINFEAPNPTIPFKESPFYITKELKNWEEKNHPRRAGVSAFGIGGTNAHIVLEEKKLEENIHQSREYKILPISAKTPAALDNMEQNLKKYITDNPKIPLVNIAYTLQTGRISYQERKCILCSRDNEAVKFSTLDINVQENSLANFSKEEITIAKSWLNKLPVNWMEIYSNNDETKIIPLPSYCFERKSYWLEGRKPDDYSTTETKVVEEKSLSFTNIEEGLTTILEKLLDKKALDKEADFYSLGADSLMLLDFQMDIEKDLNIKISLSDFEQHNSISKLLSFISKQDIKDPIKSTTNIIPINQKNSSSPSLPSLAVEIKSGDSSPLFCIHPAGGLTAVFQDLAKHISHNQRMIGIKAKGWEKGEKPDSDIKVMAKRYLKVIEEIQPEGPYFICGSSMGGTVSFEIAKLLEKKSQKVELLAMLDSPPPAIEFAEKVPETDQEIIGYVKTLSNEVASSLDKMEKNRKGALKQFLNIWRHHRDTASKYKTTPYNGKVTYFKAKELSEFLPQNLEYNWIPLVKGGIEILEVDGNHLTMHLEPNIKKIAEIINNKILASSFTILPPYQEQTGYRLSAHG